MTPQEDLNKKVKQWGNSLKTAVQGRNPNLKEFKVAAKYKDGLPQRIRITFPKHYVFVEKGVGKGRGINSGKTTPKPAINPAIEAGIDTLADIAAAGMLDIAAGRLFIK